MLCFSTKLVGFRSKEIIKIHIWKIHVVILLSLPKEVSWKSDVMREVELVGHWGRPSDGFILSLSVKVAFMNYTSYRFWPSWKSCWILCCGKCRPAAPQEEQGERPCLRHEVSLEVLGTEREHASSSSCLSSAHSTLALLPGRGWGGFAVVCDWWDARTLWAILSCLLLSAKSWLHMSGDFY